MLYDYPLLAHLSLISFCCKPLIKPLAKTHFLTLSQVVEFCYKTCKKGSLGISLVGMLVIFGLLNYELEFMMFLFCYLLLKKKNSQVKNKKKEKKRKKKEINCLCNSFPLLLWGVLYYVGVKGVVFVW